MGGIGNYLDISGECYGDLMALDVVGSDGPSRAMMWQYRCVCGHVGEMRSDKLRSKAHKCWHGQVKGATIEHWLTYKSWVRMRERCYRESHPHYADYGGRGIVVCDRWRESFADFLKDMGPRPSSDYSIERRDVNGNYEPSNCCWATDAEQRANKRNTLTVTFADGTVAKIVDLAAEASVSRETLYGRIKRGWPIEKALKTPARSYHHCRGRIRPELAPATAGSTDGAV